MKSDQLIEYAAARIHDVFAVSFDEARAHAAELVEVIAAHGGLPSQDQIEGRLERHFANRLAWRSADRKQQYLEGAANRASGYTEFLDRARTEWWKKWFIILDIAATGAATIAALASATLVLGVVYWLLRERDEQSPVSAPRHDIAPR